MPLIRYRSGGLIKGAYCSFCGAYRDAISFQENARWMLRMRGCGHIGFRGWTNDVKELERKGFINAKSKKEQNQDVQRANRERAAYEVQKLLNQGRVSELGVTEKTAKDMIRTWTPE